MLFNGGFFASNVLRARLLEILVSWFRTPGQDGAWQPMVLDHDRLDLAVARGAAYYGMVRRGLGVRIRPNWPARITWALPGGMQKPRPCAWCRGASKRGRAST